MMTSLPPPPPSPPPQPKSFFENDDNDYGPFFYLEFTFPDETNDKSEIIENDVVSDEEDVKFTLMSNLSGDSVESASDVNFSVSPSDELFFKGGFHISQCLDVTF
nr:probable membrane-associated kinase regulator 2 [Tanacetum cinerariifolium]